MKTILRELLAPAAACLAVTTHSHSMDREDIREIERPLTDFSKWSASRIRYCPNTTGGHMDICLPNTSDPVEAPIDRFFLPIGLPVEQGHERRGRGSESRDPQDRGLFPMDGREDHGSGGSSARLVDVRMAEGRAQEETQQVVAAANVKRGEENKQRFSRAIEEVIVTAQKREQALIDVPISIVALSAAELEERKVTSFEDLASAVPGLAIQNNGGYQRRIMLRGIGNVFGQGSLIGVYLDEASVTSDPRYQLDLRTYDLERVEVLRGPQGTLYGEGSVGGTIRFITKNPVLDQFSGSADFTALFTQDGEPGQRINGALNVPLIENELGVRISGTYDRQGGWIDQPAADRTDFNDQDLADVRFKGLWQPTSQFAVNAMAVIHRNDASFTSGEDASGDFTQTLNLTTTPSVEDNYDLYNVTMAYDFPAIRVLSTTSYVEQEKEIRAIGLTFQFTPPPSPRFHFHNFLLSQRGRFVTEELRLTSIGSGAWQWTIGAFYRDTRNDTHDLAAFTLPGRPILPTAAQSSNISESWAAFGDISYQVTDKFTLGTGLRYFEDDRETRQVLPTATLQEETFYAVNPRVYAQYKLNDDVNTYASAAKGFRSGGFNRAGFPSFDAEDVWTYELGTKMSLYNGRLSADVAVFYSDYKDYQIIAAQASAESGVGVLFFTRNAGDAEIKGIECGLTWRPRDSWTFSVTGNYVNAEFHEIDAIASTHAVGDPLDMIPEYGYTVSAQRDFQWSRRSGFARLDYNEQGRSTYRNRTVGPWYFSESDIINMLNANVTLQWSHSVSVGLFAHNMLNDRGFIDPFSAELNASRSRPRTFGVEFGISFE